MGVEVDFLQPIWKRGVYV